MKELKQGIPDDKTNDAVFYSFFFFCVVGDALTLIQVAVYIHVQRDNETLGTQY